MKETKNLYLKILTAAVVFLAAAVIFLGVRILNITKETEKNSAFGTVSGQPEIEICLPEKYYAASGLTMEIYNSQITNQGAHISQYDVLWECEIGECLERKFQIAAAEDQIDEYPLTVSVFATDGTLLAQEKTTLCVVEAKKWQFSVLTIGDSLSANGALYSRLQEHLDQLLVCNGTRGYEGFLTEARLGFSAADYLSETSYDLEEGETVHKFWNPEKERFDWNYYKSTTGFDPDVVILHLGTNGLLSGEENAENICKIVELIRKDDKKLPIYVVNTIYQSDQNGIGSMKMNNGALMFQGEYKQQRDLAVFQLMQSLNEKLSGEKNVYLVPAGISVDSENVFVMEERQVNPYSEETEAVAVDAVHPGAAGYYQIADTIYSTICGTADQW